MLNKALAQYQQVNTESALDNASPHRLTQMLMEGVLQRLAEARGAMQRQSIAGKGEAIGKAVSIVGGLRASLNKEVGGDMAASLDDLYDYMQRRLLEANLRSSEALIDEVMDLMRTVKSGWDGIAQEVA